METHRRLAPCPAALEDRKLGPSTGIQGEKEGRDHDQDGGRCLALATFVCLHVRDFTYMGHHACWVALPFIFCLTSFLIHFHLIVVFADTKPVVEFHLIFFPHYFSLNELSRSLRLSCCRILKYEPIHLSGFKCFSVGLIQSVSHKITFRGYEVWNKYVMWVCFLGFHSMFDRQHQTLILK